MGVHFIRLGLLRIVFKIAVACREGAAPEFFCVTEEIAGEFLKKILVDNFCLECPTDLRSMPLSYIFDALFSDTPLGHVQRMQANSQIANLAKYLDIWLFGYLAACDKHARVGYP